MKTFLILPNEKSAIPEQFQSDDNRFPESLAEYFIQQYTKAGDRVLDPFAGLGTTLIVAESLDRKVAGTELNSDRHAYMTSKLTDQEYVLCANALDIGQLSFSLCDFSLSSPLYNPVGDKNYLSGRNGYQGYLQDIQTIYRGVSSHIKPGGYIVIEVSNLKGTRFTPLARDIARVVGEVIPFETEVIIGRETQGTCPGGGTYGYGYDHSYCLVFRKE